MNVHLYRCVWNDKWYGDQQEFIFALDAQHAEDIVNDRFNYQNHIKDLRISEIPMREVTRQPRQGRVLVKGASRTPGEGMIKSEYYIDITRYYCSGCQNQVMPGGDFCPYCGGYFRKEEKKC